MHKLLTLGLIALCALQVNAWGRLGHYIIGEATWQLIDDPTRELVLERGYLSENFNGSLGTASIWADAAKYTPTYGWTRGLHYWDNEISTPPSYCQLEDYNNKGKPNVLTAINNFTEHHQRDNKVDSRFHFLMTVHLLQDMYQPLHLSGTKRGGTQEFVTPPGKSKAISLHEYWDVNLIKKLVGTLENLSNTIYEVVRSASEQDISPEHCVSNLYDEAKETELLNCDVVWQLPVDEDYEKLAVEAVFDLLVRSARQSACHLNYEMFTTTEKQDETVLPRDDFWQRVLSVLRTSPVL